MKQFLLVLFFFFVFVSESYAHLLGASFEKEVDGYILDMGYSPETFVAGETHTFDFAILDGQNRERLSFHDLWIRIEKDKKTVLATGISSGFNNVPTVLFVFPEEGEYTVYVRFQQEDMEKMAEAEFPIVVGSANQSLPILEIGIGLFIAFIIGAGSFYIFKKRKNWKSKKE